MNYTDPPFDDETSPFYRQEKVKIFIEKNHLPAILVSDEAEAIVKDAGETYLIRRPEKVEPQEAYDNRLKSAVLVNAYADGIDSYASMVGAAGVTMSDESKNDRTEVIYGKTDHAGNNLETFATKLFGEGIGVGSAFVVVDGPAIGSPVTKSEAIESGRRPWLSMFGADQLLGWREQDGELTEARYYWVEAAEGAGYSDSFVWKVREYELASGKVISRTWEWVGSLSDPEEVILNISMIPVVPFLPGSEIGIMLSYPPAARLASLTKAYYNSCSLQQNYGVVARSPLFTVIGATVTEILHSLSSVFCLDRTKQEAEAGYNEPSGVGAEFGWKDLEKIENAFRYWGVELERQNGTVLATTKIIDNSRMVDKIRAWSGELEKTLQQAFVIVEEYHGEKFPENGIIVGTEYGVPSLTSEQVQMIKMTADAGGIGGEQLLDLLKIYVPQMGDTSWEDVQESQIQINQASSFTGLDTGTLL